MASPTTINAWAEELALSLLPHTIISSTKSRKFKDLFGRRLKHHNFGRTNQFEVEERLDGIEEKCQILNRDDLSDALRSRRLELRKCDDEKWLPDILDLFLHLSNDPANKSRLERLSEAQIRADPPSPLRWAEIEVDDPFDRSDPIWRQPQYSDLSSDEDEPITSTSKIRPSSSECGLHLDDTDMADLKIKDSLKIESTGAASLRDLRAAQFWRKPDPKIYITELQAIREILSMLQGFPTNLYTNHEGKILSNPKFHVRHIGHQALRSVLASLGEIGVRAKLVRQGIPTRRDVSYLQVMQDYVEAAAQNFGSFMSHMESDIQEKSRTGGIVSLMSICQRIEDGARPLSVLEKLSQNLEGKDPVGCLETLFNIVSQAELCNDSLAVKILMPIFLSTFELYSKPIDLWLQEGTIDSDYERFFVIRNEDSSKKAALWYDWYSFQQSGPHRAPSFLEGIAPRIFAAGKTTAFLRELNDSPSHKLHLTEKLGDAVLEIHEATKSSLVPFVGAFAAVVDDHVSNALNISTKNLKFVLETKCELHILFDALWYIYLAKSGVVMDKIESRIFHQIDRCIETWNDRFLVADMLEEAYLKLDCITLERIIVQSEHTSSRSMESRRRSVRILESLALQYILPWPIANLILPQSMASYRRVSLLLCQIRRAKYTLERVVHFNVNNVAITEDQSDQKFIQGLYYSILLFVNILYNHLTTCVIEPLTNQMRQRFTGTVDEMIEVHDQYVRSLEQACLTSKNLKMIKDSVIVMLDLCIRFSDLVTSPTNTNQKSLADFEASSFTSARSRRRKKRAVDDSSSSDEDDDDNNNAEGYSTFILEEDTTVMEEIKKIAIQFPKNLSFLVAGLRGASRSLKASGELLELLADRLDNTFQRKNSGLF